MLVVVYTAGYTGTLDGQGALALQNLSARPLWIKTRSKYCYCNDETRPLEQNAAAIWPPHS
ncbi:MAG TPA: hypothetical protein VKQ72_15420 [Aggregatilineales bacterium]|nr:hypothetical protein [Aggregatilineales bacterium]